MAFAVLLALASACGGGAGGSSSGHQRVSGISALGAGVHDDEVEANVDGMAQASQSSGPLLTLAVKFVQYLNESGAPVLSKPAVEAVTLGMNRLFGQCSIRFLVEQYVPAQPAPLGLDYNTSSMGDLERIRASFDAQDALVVINTGAWNHARMGVANAWTTMPGMVPAGAVIEGPVAGDAPLVAHEIGHYLNLDHVSNSSNMMNPQIFDSSTQLSAAQCETARASALQDRAAALRS